MATGVAIRNSQTKKTQNEENKKEPINNNSSNNNNNSNNNDHKDSEILMGEYSDSQPLLSQLLHFLF